MDIDGLPMIGPGVDYTQVRAIHQKRTLAFINYFILNTVAFLNKFSRSCELRFEKFESRIQKLEASLCILEAKLISISGLDKVAAIPPLLEQKHDLEETIINDNRTEIPKETAEAPQESAITTSLPVDSRPTFANDERFTRFFKMIQVGVPIQAVRLKMQAEGLDPSVLDKPSELSDAERRKSSVNTSDSESTASSFSD